MSGLVGGLCDGVENTEGRDKGAVRESWIPKRQREKLFGQRCEKGDIKWRERESGKGKSGLKGA